MAISFDNSCRLARRTYTFEYSGVRFKLIQDSPRRWADHLLTIVPRSSSPEADRASAAACEFASALGWEHRANVAVWESGGRGWRDGQPLRHARPSVFNFPRLAFGGGTVGCDLHRLPKIENDEQRKALALYREAGAANTVYLKFLFYWQVMEIGRGANPVAFVNRTWKHDRQRLALHRDDVSSMPLHGRSLGNYLLDDCRHAIAHIKRKPGRAALALDVREERRRLEGSTLVVKEFAAHYIRTQLGLIEHVDLLRPTNGGVARFVDLRTLHAGRFKRAYPRPDLRHIFGARQRRRRPWE